MSARPLLSDRLLGGLEKSFDHIWCLLAILAVAAIEEATWVAASMALVYFTFCITMIVTLIREQRHR